MTEAETDLIRRLGEAEAETKKHLKVEELELYAYDICNIPASSLVAVISHVRKCERCRGQISSLQERRDFYTRQVTIFGDCQ